MNIKLTRTNMIAVNVFQYSLGNFVLICLSGGRPISILTAEPFLSMIRILVIVNRNSIIQRTAAELYYYILHIWVIIKRIILFLEIGYELSIPYFHT